MKRQIFPQKMRLFMPILLALLFVLSGCGSNDDTQYYTHLSELEHKRIGALTGSIEAIHVRERLPNAELVLYDAYSDIREALISGKLDAYADTDVIAWAMVAESPQLVSLEEPISETMEGGSIFPNTASGKALCDEYSNYIKELKKDGTFYEIQKIWLGFDESKKVVPDVSTLDGSKRKLLVALDPTSVPFCYVQHGNA